MITGHSSDQAAAQIAVLKLQRDIADMREARHHHNIAPPHKGSAYHKACVRFAHKSNKLEKDFTHQMVGAAAEITKLCKRGWEKNPSILDLWHQLALAVTHFSEHPNKKVATLILSKNGALQAFSANRVPEGVLKRAHHYTESHRKDFIVCSERMALMRLLAIKPQTRRPVKGLKGERYRHTAISVQNMTDEVIAAARGNNILKGSFILATTSPCETCAHAIAPFHPKAVFAGQKGHDHFGAARKLSITKAADYLKSQGTQVIPLP
jgi:deoxycytidylate deaminase